MRVTVTVGHYLELQVVGVHRIPGYRIIQSGQLTDVTVATLNLKTARSGFVPKRLNTILLNTECRSVVSKAFRDEKTFHL